MRSPHRFLPLAVVTASLLATIVPLPAQPASSAPLNGQVFINHGLVGVGRLPSATRDKFGETVGSFSALTYDAKSWRRNPDGSYAGTFYMQPDRGYNNPNTTNWRARFFTLAITFRPTLLGTPGQNQVGITVADTTLLTEANGTPLTALDTTTNGTGTREGFPPLPQAFNGRLSLDAEGIVRLPDGSLFISDEYGPYIFKFSADGRLLAAIRPPDALIPRRNNGDSFASNNPGPDQPAPAPLNPDTGRQNNQARGLAAPTARPSRSSSPPHAKTVASAARPPCMLTPPRLRHHGSDPDPQGRIHPATAHVPVRHRPHARGRTKRDSRDQQHQFLVLARDSAAATPTPHHLALPASSFYDQRRDQHRRHEIDDPANPVAPPAC